MKKFLLVAFVALGLVWLVGGCGNSSRPMMGLGLELTALERAADGTATATVTLVNPNVGPYNFASATHRIYVQDRLLGTLTIASPTAVAPQQSATQSGPLALEKGAAWPQGAVRYRLESTLKLRLYGDNTQAHKLQGAGTIEVTSK